MYFSQQTLTAENSETSLSQNGNEENQSILKRFGYVMGAAIGKGAYARVKVISSSSNDPPPNLIEFVLDFCS